MRVRGLPAGAVVTMVMALALFGLRPARAAFTVQRVDEAHFTVDPDKPVFVLVMGNDGRPGDSVTRGDALHLIGINPGQGRATILDIPRDTFVPVPGLGRTKINAAHVAGGPVLQARAVGDLVGVPVSIVVDTDFAGFMAMVDDLGGVDVDVPVAMNDPLSGAIFPAGPIHLDGGGALAFARNRRVSGGDFTRSENQGRLLLAGLAKLRNEGTDAAKVLHDVAVFARHGRFDGLSLADLYRLARLAVSLDPANVRNVVMPGSVGNAANQSVVFVGRSAAGLFADFRDDAVLQSH
jgi:LCP family protein required for cell wall assembly